MAQLFTNFAATTLASPILASDTIINVVDGSSFPVPTGDDFFHMVLATAGQELTREIVRVNARIGNTLTVVRAQEGTLASVFDADDKAELRDTALLLNELSRKLILTSITRSPTGFVSPKDVVSTYDAIARTITLSGSVEAYWQGTKIPALGPGWVSDAHADTPGAWFLFFDGTSFVWQQTSWSFDMLQIAFVYYGATNKFALRECHGLMEWQTHEELHRRIGTYLYSGADLSGYVLSSTTAANRRPAISAASIFDEDLESVVASLAAGGPYTIANLTGTGTTTFALASAEIALLSGSLPYYNKFTSPNWVQTVVSANAYMCMWLVAVPTTADSGSQSYRYMWIQGQSSGNLASQQAATFGDLNLGQLTQITPEFVPVARVIIRRSAGDWQLTQVDKIVGSRAQIASVPSGFLSSVSVTAPLAGSGTATEPLTVQVAQGLTPGKIPVVAGGPVFADGPSYDSGLGVLTLGGLNLGETTFTHFKEGTWTPTIIGSTAPGVNTYTKQDGTYRRIGNICMAEFTIVMTALGTGGNAMAGSLRIGGLPYTENANNDCGGLMYGISNTLAFPVGTTMLGLYVVPSSTTAALFASGSGVSTAVVPVANLTGPITLRGFVRIII